MINQATSCKHRSLLPIIFFNILLSSLMIFIEKREIFTRAEQKWCLACLHSEIPLWKGSLVLINAVQRFPLNGSCYFTVSGAIRKRHSLDRCLLLLEPVEASASVPSVSDTLMYACRHNGSFQILANKKYKFTFIWRISQDCSVTWKNIPKPIAKLQMNPDTRSISTVWSILRNDERLNPRESHTMVYMCGNKRVCMADVIKMSDKF